MNRTTDLIVWAVPYSLAWSLKAVGIDLKTQFPDMAKAVTKPEEALQQGVAVAALGLITIPFFGEFGLILTVAIGAIKVYNLLRIDLNK